MLKQQAITQLVDIRTIPKSRHNPQYGNDELPASLKQAGIKYSYLEKLGGLRPVTKPSTNTAWRNASFRNYADYMQTDDFKVGLEELIDLANGGVTAIMCAEAVPWRCHRSLVSDALLARKITVYEIISPKSIRPHKLIDFAVVDEDNSVSYPGDIANAN